MPGGMLIAICGIDGSGKTTQTALLADRLAAVGRAAHRISFPRYGEGFFAEVVQRYLRGDFGARPGDVSPYLAALPFALDRWQALPQLREWLRSGDVVLCNRYVPANVAHQGSKLAREEWEGFCRWVEQMEYEALGLPRPALHVLLDVPAGVAARLAGARGERGGLTAAQDIHERDLAYLAATAEAYRGLAARTPGSWVVIRCAEGEAMRAPERIAGDVWAAVSARL